MQYVQKTYVWSYYKTKNKINYLNSLNSQINHITWKTVL